jgi:hypothetical protein
VCPGPGVFEEPIELPDGRKLKTLAEAMAWLAKEIPKSKWFYDKALETGHDGVSHPINSRGMWTRSQPLAIFPLQYPSRRDQAMTKQPPKQMPWWITIDVAVILVSLVIIGVGVWIAP